MTEHEIEPIPGLPGQLPPGERILWQGSPEWRVLARSAFHTRGIAGYFGLLIAVSLAFGSITGVVMTAALGSVALGLLHLLARASARTTLYTLTNRRIVFRIGVAVPKCINLPLSQIASVDLACRPDGTGDLPLTLLGSPRMGYLAFWPHVRPWTVGTPRPMLRAIPDAANVAALVARACLAANPGGQIAAVEVQTQPMPAMAQVA
ncbi:photosynthetic complex putative assembly protein PuhB [Rhizorhabdus sp. FW153]|uniref:photosynthetic complex putative assembly protein PuhB n=1 Tax=Rhizorhabdus sp. FW153 TaxID=3400216 RepID=UPI003CED201A